MRYIIVFFSVMLLILAVTALERIATKVEPPWPMQELTPEEKEADWHAARKRFADERAKMEEKASEWRRSRPQPKMLDGRNLTPEEEAAVERALMRSFAAPPFAADTAAESAECIIAPIICSYEPDGPPKLQPKLRRTKDGKVIVKTRPVPSHGTEKAEEQIDSGPRGPSLAWLDFGAIERHFGAILPLPERKPHLASPNCPSSGQYHRYSIPAERLRMRWRSDADWSTRTYYRVWYECNEMYRGSGFWDSARQVERLLRMANPREYYRARGWWRRGTAAEPITMAEFFRGYMRYMDELRAEKVVP